MENMGKIRDIGDESKRSNIQLEGIFEKREQIKRRNNQKNKTRNFFQTEGQIQNG